MRHQPDKKTANEDVGWIKLNAAIIMFRNRDACSTVETPRRASLQIKIKNQINPMG